MLQTCQKCTLTEVKTLTSRDSRGLKSSPGEVAAFLGKQRAFRSISGFAEEGLWVDGDPRMPSNTTASTLRRLGERRGDWCIRPDACPPALPVKPWTRAAALRMRAGGERPTLRDSHRDLNGPLPLGFTPASFDAAVTF